MTERRFPGVLFLIAVLLLWEVIARLAIVRPPVFLPPITEIIATLWRLTLSLELPGHVAITAGRCLTGLVGAAAIGVPLGLLIGHSKAASALLGPTLEALRPMPPAALIPVAILFLGIDSAMKIAVITFGCLWPILLNTVAGVHALDAVLIDTARTLRLGRRRFLWEVVIKGASPYIFTGIRISLAIALILSIVTEMIAGNTGVGHFLILSERSFLFSEMYAGLLAVGLTGFLLNHTFVYLVDRHLLRWHKAFRATL